MQAQTHTTPATPVAPPPMTLRHIAEEMSALNITATPVLWLGGVLANVSLDEAVLEEVFDHGNPHDSILGIMGELDNGFGVNLMDADELMDVLHDNPDAPLGTIYRVETPCPHAWDSRNSFSYSWNLKGFTYVYAEQIDADFLRTVTAWRDKMLDKWYAANQRLTSDTEWEKA